MVGFYIVCFLQCRRLEKRLADASLQLEDERRNIEQHKEQASFCYFIIQI